MKRDQAEIDAEEHRLGDTVEHSFNIYQATFAMAAIFIGFVFTGLLQILTEPVQTIPSPVIPGSQIESPDLPTLHALAVWLLTIAMILFTFAILSFHATAHRVIRYWKSFYPVSRFTKLGFWAFTLGLLMMFGTISVLLWGRNLHVLSGIVVAASLGLTAYGFVPKAVHENQPYLRDVDKP